MLQWITLCTRIFVLVVMSLPVSFPAIGLLAQMLNASVVMLCYGWATFTFTSVQFSRSVVSSSLQPHGLWHARLPCPSSTPRACSNSCPSSRWCHPTISSSVVPFSSHLQSFPASGSSQRSQVARVLEFQLQHQSFQRIFRTDFLRMDWWNLLAVQRTLKSLLQHHSSKTSNLRCSAFFMVQLSHP